MNLLKRSSPLPRQTRQSPLYGGRLTPSPHYPQHGSTPGSPLTTTHRTSGPAVSSLLLQMGGENSAFKALVPNSAALLAASTGLHVSSGGYVSGSDSDEEINVNDESDIEEIPPASRVHESSTNHNRSRSCSPVDVDEEHPAPARNENPSSCQPLQLTMHDRD